MLWVHMCLELASDHGEAARPACFHTSPQKSCMRSRVAGRVRRRLAPGLSPLYSPLAKPASLLFANISAQASFKEN